MNYINHSDQYKKSVQQVCDFLYLTYDLSINQDLRNALTLNPTFTTITSPFGVGYLNAYGYDKYGSVKQLHIRVSDLQKLKYRNNYEEYAAEVMHEMCAPVEFAYYFMLASIWTLPKSETHDTQETLNFSKSAYFASLAKRYIELAIYDILYELEEIYDGEFISTDILMDEVRLKIIYYLTIPF